MCGRFNVTEDPLTEIFLDLVGQPFPGTENYNTAPTEDVWVIRDRDGAFESMQARWWLTPWWSKEPSTKYAMFNAKSETLAKSSAFKEPFQRRRCVVPVSGFYEWTKSPHGKMPHYIRPAADDGILLAGLWDRWRNRKTDEVLRSFTIVTTAVNEQLEFVHNRQPVILSRDGARVWLDHDVPASQLQPLFDSRLPAPLSVIPVSTYVSNARNKEARCIDPIGRTVDVERDSDDRR